ncbi:MAG: right-handed parallel beta-helix repeat-containing protein, partial [Thermoplasmatales archaeon]|nr:right-handed parallel beta-helix repeat-containing protein [Thermoplasmatales archaeon]
MNKRIILFVIFFCMVFAVISVNIGITEGEQGFSRAGSRGLEPHDPIYINGNEDFIVGQNGVVNGDGTEWNPYIIEGWDIDASQALGDYLHSSAGIRIENTNACFIVRNCVIHDGKTNYKHGISFSSVQNGKIDNIISCNNNYGISVGWHSTNNTITNCSTYNNDFGISLARSSNITVTNCNIYNNTWYGIQLVDSSNSNIVTNCDIYNNANGFRLKDGASNNKITNCSVYNNSHDGIYLIRASNTTIINCTIYNNSYGIFLHSSLDNEVHYCNIYNNTNYGVYNYNSELDYQVNATYNWWGSPDGPGGVGPGNGDNITDNVLYDPWLTDPAEIEMSTPSGDGENNPPTLSNGTVSPLSGYLDTVFKFNVTYTDEDNDTPAYVNVIIDGSAYNMTKQDNSDNNYTDGCVYEHSTNLSKGFHTYYFEASDGINTTTYPPNPPIYGTKVTEKEEGEAEAPQVIYYLILIIVIIAVEIAGGAVFLIMRKRIMILKCPKCGTIFKVKRKKEAFKVECPTCGAEGTIKPAVEKKTPP